MLKKERGEYHDHLINRPELAKQHSCVLLSVGIKQHFVLFFNFLHFLDFLDQQHFHHG